MVDLVLDVAVVWMTLLLAAVAGMAVRRLPAVGRMLAVDTLAMLLVGVLALLAYARAATAYLDVALVLALLASLGTLAAARFHRERRSE